MVRGDLPGSISGRRNFTGRPTVELHIPNGEKHMALNAPTRDPLVKPAAAVALGRPPEVLGGWLPLVAASTISIVILAMLLPSVT